MSLRRKKKGKSKVLSCGFCLRDSEAEQRAFRFLHIHCSNVNSYSSAPDSNGPNPRPPFYLDYDKIKQVHKTKHLGLAADDKLSWNEQYKSVKRKLAIGLSSRRKLKNISPQSQLHTVVVLIG